MDPTPLQDSNRLEMTDMANHRNPAGNRNSKNSLGNYIREKYEKQDFGENDVNRESNGAADGRSTARGSPNRGSRCRGSRSRRTPVNGNAESGNSPSTNNADSSEKGVWRLRIWQLVLVVLASIGAGYGLGKLMGSSGSEESGEVKGEVKGDGKGDAKGADDPIDGHHDLHQRSISRKARFAHFGDSSESALDEDTGRSSSEDTSRSSETGIIEISDSSDSNTWSSRESEKGSKEEANSSRTSIPRHPENPFLGVNPKGGDAMHFLQDRCPVFEPKDPRYFELKRAVALKKGDENAPVVGYVDGCFDGLHAGHLNVIRQAKRFCDILVVGIHSNAEIARAKGPPVMTEKERYAMLDHVKWADRIVYDVPYTPSIELLDRDNVRADYAFHGDDMPVDAQTGRSAYQDLLDAGRLVVLQRTEGVSTTDRIGRLLALAGAKEREEKKEDSKEDISRALVATGSKPDAESKTPKLTLSSQGITLLTSMRRMIDFARPHRTPTKSDTIVYTDGVYDVFNTGHASTLKKAREQGSYLIVGLHDDAVSRQLKGVDPIETMNERALTILGCKWVDELVLAAPALMTEDMVKSLRIDKVVIGTYTVKHPEQGMALGEDIVEDNEDNGSHDNTNLLKSASDNGDKLKLSQITSAPAALSYVQSHPKSYAALKYQVALNHHMLSVVGSEYPDLDAKSIGIRVAVRKGVYEKRNENRMTRELNYYADKAVDGDKKDKKDDEKGDKKDHEKEDKKD